MTDSALSASGIVDPATGPLRVVPADTRRRVREFVRFPYRLYRDHPWWVPPLRIDERARIDPRKNPFFDHGEIVPLLAVRGRRIVGRVAAIEDRLHDEIHEAGTAFFGFFEAAAREPAIALLEAVERWAAKRERRRVRGPVNPSLNDSAGLLVDGFRAPPALMMPWTPPEYVDYLAAAGYEKVKDLLAWRFDLDQEIPERIQDLIDRRRTRGDVRVRQLDPDDFWNDVEAAMEIYRAAWVDNWGFIPPTDREIEYLARRIEPILDPRGVVFVELEGRPVGFSVSVRDYNQVFARMNGRLLPSGIFRLMRAKRTIDRGRLLLLGMLPEYRRSALFLLLIDETLRASRQEGIREGEISWTLEDNHLVNRGIEAFGGEHYRTYRILQKSLDSSR